MFAGDLAGSFHAALYATHDLALQAFYTAALAQNIKVGLLVAVYHLFE